MGEETTTSNNKPLKSERRPMSKRVGLAALAALRAIRQTAHGIVGPAEGVDRDRWGLPVAQTRERVSVWKRVPWVRVGLSMVLVVGLAGFAIAAENHAADHDATKVTLDDLMPATVDVPWATGKARDRVVADVQAGMRDRLFASRIAAADGSLALLGNATPSTIATAIAAEPWIATVDELTAAFPARVSMSITLRTPRVAVVTGERIVLVADDGVVLPLAFRESATFEAFNAELQPPLPLVLGRESRTNTASPGELWDDAGIIAAREVAADVAPLRSFGLAIDSIDVRNVGGVVAPTGSEVTLDALLPNGHRIRILWGRDSANAKASENSADTKLDQIRRTLSQHRNPTAIEAIDVRFPSVRLTEK